MASSGFATFGPYGGPGVDPQYGAIQITAANSGKIVLAGGLDLNSHILTFVPSASGVIGFEARVTTTGID